MNIRADTEHLQKQFQVVHLPRLHSRSLLTSVDRNSGRNRGHLVDHYLAV